MVGKKPWRLDHAIRRVCSMLGYQEDEFNDSLPLLFMATSGVWAVFSRLLFFFFFFFGYVYE